MQKLSLSILTFITLMVSVHYVASAQFCFNITPSHPANSLRASSIVTADFNSDGKPDFAMGHASGVKVSLQQANNNLDSVLKVDSFNFSHTICTADFNGDGHTDIIAYDFGPGCFTIHLGNGNGGFITQTQLICPGLYNAYNHICSADFNNDGFADLALTTGFNFIKVFLGNGNGTFSNLITAATNSIFTGELIAADFNNDSNIDLATPNLVMLGNGTGGFSTGTQLSGTFNPQSITAGDFNNDGKLDLAVSCSGSTSANTSFIGELATYLGDGLGGFAIPIKSSLGDSTYADISLQSSVFANADLDGDGKLDLAAGVWNIDNGEYKNHLIVLQGNGLGGFNAPVVFSTIKYPKALLINDVNQDGKMDIAVVDKDSLIGGFSKLTILYNCAGYANGLSDLPTTNDLGIYPNPSKGLLNIVSTEKIIAIKITNSFGQLIYSGQPNVNQFNFTIETNGIYMATISTVTKNIARKFIITK